LARPILSRPNLEREFCHGIGFLLRLGIAYAWRVWLSLGHKALPYTLHMLSFSGGDLKKPEYLAINPRHKVPALTDEGLAVYESAAIVEYLEDAYGHQGARLFPASARERARARRLVREADEYMAHALEVMVEEILFKPQERWDVANIQRGRDAFVAELNFLEGQIRQPFLVGEAGATDYTYYPLIALALRMQGRRPELAIREAIGPAVRDWMQRVEALPIFATTYPPHWKSG